ncbi:eukaryotic rRNA processing [Lichtheimia hyalospora FSU 10163]|nr:eukaryotic rRNA processing [Lichtheimia hyalospora FSU 10163]
MGIKKPSKSKLKRLEKRKAIQEEQEPAEPVEQTVLEEDEEEDEEAPIAVPIDDMAEESEDDQDEENDESDEEVEEELIDQTQQPKREKRQPINNEAELQRLTEEIKLKNLPWIETLTVTSSEPLVIEDIKDDMTRELAFYQQALEAAHIARDKIIDAGVPFSRPDDYFAEMIKSDEHMAKIRQRLVNEDARVKAAEEAKLQRKLKKFGKKVQVEKQLQRQKEKSETLEKIKLLKRSK